MRFAALQRPAMDGWTWKSSLGCAFLVLGLWLMLYALSLASDSSRAATEVAKSRRDAAVMICNDGVIVYLGDSTLHKLTGHIFDDGIFRCTDWRMRDVGTLR